MYDNERTAVLASLGLNDHKGVLREADVPLYNKPYIIKRLPNGSFLPVLRIYPTVGGRPEMDLIPVDTEKGAKLLARACATEYTKLTGTPLGCKRGQGRNGTDDHKKSV